MRTPEEKLKTFKEKQLFTVPDGYFDKLPRRVQARVISPERQGFFKFPIALKYSLAVIALTIAVVFWMKSNNINSTQNVDELLAEISTNDIIDYLDESDLLLLDIIERMDKEESILDSYMNKLDTISEEDIMIYLEDYELTGEYL